MTASTEHDPRRSPEPRDSDPTVHPDAAARPADPVTGRVHAVPTQADAATTGSAPAATPASTGGKTSRVAGARRVVGMKVAAAIALVAFLLGAGAALLVGGLAGPGGGGPGGAGGPGGPPGTSQSSTTGSGTSTTGT